MNIYFKIIYFTLLFLIFNIDLKAETAKLKIVQIATADIAKIIQFIDNNYSLKVSMKIAINENTKETEILKKEIQELLAYVEDNQDSLTEQEIEQIKEDIFDKDDQIKQLKESANNDQLNNEVLSPQATNLLYQIIKKVAEKEGFSMVIEKSSSILYVEKEFDITKKIIRELAKLVK